MLVVEHDDLHLTHELLELLRRLGHLEARVLDLGDGVRLRQP